MSQLQTTITPHNQLPYVTRQLTTDIDAVVDNAVEAQKAWRRVQLEQRIAIGLRFIVSSAEHGANSNAHKVH